MVDNLTRQVEEVEALSSIYGVDWQTEDEVHRSYSIKIEENGWTAVLYVTLPFDYPSKSPPQYQLSAPSLSLADKQLIASELEQVYLDNIGENVIFQWVEKVREQLQQKEHELQSVASLEIEEEFIETSVPEPTNNTVPEKTIIHGTIITDRKSVFQGHVANVTCTEQVKQVLKTLYEHKKIEHATHNIYAYRIYKEDNKTYIQDCEDDGETQAGGRLLHLLQILDVKNVLVIVSRWYGGIHLGPDRFRHINNAARQVLDAAGLLNTITQQKKSKKKE